MEDFSIKRLIDEIDRLRAEVERLNSAAPQAVSKENGSAVVGQTPAGAAPVHTDKQHTEALKLANEWKDWFPYPDSPRAEWDRFNLACAYLALTARSAGVSIRHPNAEQASVLANEIERSEICKGLVYEDRGLVVEALRTLASSPHSASEGRRDDNDELNRLSGPGIRKA